MAPRWVPLAVARMALDRRHARHAHGLTFGKLLGTGTGRTFTLRDVNLRRWGLLAAWRSSADAEAFEDSPTVGAWGRIAEERWRVELRPLSARGHWARQQPFGDPAADEPTAAGQTVIDGPVAAVTRARLSLPRAKAFWRAAPPVSADLRRAPGLVLSLGIGEAPLGLQGTFSVWSDARALRGFAYRRPAHAAVIRRAAEEGWYVEELFARFAVLDARGTVGGRNPLAGLILPRRGRREP